MRAVLIRISTQTVIKKANYPNIDIVPVVGLDPDLKWLIINELARPSFNSSIEKLGILEEITTDPHPIYPALHQYRISYPIIALTQGEIDAILQAQEDNDASVQTVQYHKSQGEIAFDKAYALIQRKFDNNVITAIQAKTLAEGIYDALEPLYKGQWRLTKVRYDLLTPPVNANLLQIFNTIKTNIDNYITANY